MRALLLSLLAIVPSSATSFASARIEPATTLDQALERVNARQVEADLTFLASDALAGRDTPSEGLRIAARYLRSRAMAAGFEPGAGDGYFHNYPLAYHRVDEEVTRLTLTGVNGSLQLEYAKDYYIASTRALKDSEHHGSVVFIGGGTQEEIDQIELGGKWALCIDKGGSGRRRQSRLKEAGAVGLTVVPELGSDKRPYSKRFANIVKRSRKPTIGWPRTPLSSRSGRYPTNYVADPGGERILALQNEHKGPLAELKLGTELAIRVNDVRGLVGEGGLVQIENVCALLPGRDPKLSKEVLLVSAHYDHVGVNDEGEIHNGADDNGSGTTTLLALADALGAYGPLNRSVMLIWVSGEEKGLLGSKAWAASPSLPEGYRAVANINIDMVGRNAPDQILVTPTDELADHYNGLTRLVEQLAPLEGFDNIEGCDEYWARSDQKEFATLGIPVCFLFAGTHGDYHRPGDDVEKIDFGKVRRVARLVLRMLDSLQEPKLAL